MFNVGPLELMVLLVLALIVFGPAKLPELMASAGNAIREFQRASRELTEVFQETQAEFSSALDLETAATTVTEPAAEPGANGHATTEVASAVPVAPDLPATTAPAEYETAAAMVDPVEPYPEPHREAEPPPAAPATAAPAEYATAAALLDDAPPPFEIKLGPSEAAPEPVTVAKVRRPRRPRAADGVSAATEPVPAGEPGAGAPPTSSTAGIGPDAAPLPESVVAIAPPPVNGATPARRRTPRPRAKAVPGPVGPGSPAPAAAPSEESA